MIDWLLELDRSLFFIINEAHTPVMDAVMKFISGKWEWAFFYVILILMITVKYKWKGLWIILFIILSIGAADFITSGIMKPFFERLRPSRDPALTGMVHMVDGYRGGMYGFASSHASTSFALITFFVLAMRNKYPFLKWLFVWAAIVSYSRIYLGVHYPGDVIVGALIGIFISCGMYRLLLKIKPEFSSTS